MLGFRFVKPPATTFVLQYRGGRLVRQGPGLAFWYFAPTSVIAQVPISSVDVPYVFTEMSADFQEVVIQGNLTHRVAEPAKLAGLLDYSVDHRGRYTSDDPTKLAERLIQTAQAGARQFIQTQSLRNLLVASGELIVAITASLKSSNTMSQLGIEILDVTVNSMRAEPEMSKALQAEAREKLLKQADEAIYARRNASVELERTIRENELETENVVAQRRRQIRETEMNAEIAVEQQRTQLVDIRVDNERKEAESRGAALAAMLQPVHGVDWRTLLAMQGHADSAMLISSAFDHLAQGAEKIGSVNISPELLETLIRHKKG